MVDGAEGRGLDILNKRRPQQTLSAFEVHELETSY